MAFAEPLRGQLLRRQWLRASANLLHRLSPEVMVSLERAHDARATDRSPAAVSYGASVMDDGCDRGNSHDVTLARPRLCRFQAGPASPTHPVATTARAPLAGPGRPTCSARWGQADAAPKPSRPAVRPPRRRLRARGRSVHPHLRSADGRSRPRPAASQAASARRRAVAVQRLGRSRWTARGASERCSSRRRDQDRVWPRQEAEKSVARAIEYPTRSWLTTPGSGNARVGVSVGRSPRGWAIQLLEQSPDRRRPVEGGLYPVSTRSSTIDRRQPPRRRHSERASVT